MLEGQGRQCTNNATMRLNRATIVAVVKPSVLQDSLFDRRYTTMWFNVFTMQLSTERHVSTLQDHHQAI